MTWALRMKVGGVLLLALAGLSLGSAAAIGVIPVAPPAAMAPALAVAVAALAAVKAAAVGGALVAHARSVY